MSTIIPDVGLVIATTGRKSVITKTIASILNRVSLPTCIVISGAQESDFPDVDLLQSGLT